MMQQFVRLLRRVGIAICAISIATCYLGPRYEVSKIPIEQLRLMGDTDWIGASWVEWSIVSLLSGIACLIAALVISLLAKGRQGGQPTALGDNREPSE